MLNCGMQGERRALRAMSAACDLTWHVRLAYFVQVMNQKLLVVIGRRVDA